MSQSYKVKNVLIHWISVLWRAGIGEVQCTVWGCWNSNHQLSFFPLRKPPFCIKLFNVVSQRVTSLGDATFSQDLIASWPVRRIRSIHLCYFFTYLLQSHYFWYLNVHCSFLYWISKSLPLSPNIFLPHSSISAHAAGRHLFILHVWIWRLFLKVAFVKFRTRFCKNN